MADQREIPFIKRFVTQNACYVYDVNTNRILDVARPVYDVLGDYGRLDDEEICRKYASVHGEATVSHAIFEIDDARRNNGFFSSSKPEKLFYQTSRDEVASYYTTRLDNVVLEVTEHCTLKCHYCPWERLRSDERKRMPVEVALSAIDFLDAHSSQVEGNRFVAFYGGEPMLEFDLISRSVAHAEALFGDRVLFSVTTNGTLVDRQKAEFLANHNFKTIVSIDGPKKVHDKHRVHVDGHGSFDRATKGLKTLLEVYGKERWNKLRINVVMTPPYDYNAIEELWSELPWLPPDMNVMIGSVVTDFTNFQDNPTFGESENRFYETIEHQKSRFLSQLLDPSKDVSQIGASLFEPSLLKMYSRPFWPAPRSSFALNGCCIPGTRKLFVKHDGTFNICERAHGVPPIGSLSNGFDMSKVWNIIETYAEQSLADCRSCWAVDLCSQCFIHAYVDHEFSLERKRRNCDTVRREAEASLAFYCSVLEKNKNALEYMDDMTIR